MGRQAFPYAGGGDERRPPRPSPDWRCTYRPGIHIFSSPDYFATRQGKLEEGDVFRVSREQKGSDGALWLQLADGRGWVFDRSVGGLGTLCVRHEEPEKKEPPAKTSAKVEEPQMAPGGYVVTSENLKVTSQKSWGSTTVARLEKGQNITVAEVALVAEPKRRLWRGRLEEPAGWATLMNLDTGSFTVARHEGGRSALEDVVAAVEEQKSCGTQLFKAGDAMAAYEAWLKAAERLEDFAPSADAARQLKAVLYSNMAQALLQCPDVQGATTHGACQMAERALALEPSHVKARFRRGCALCNAGQLAEAAADFEEVLALEPANAAAAQRLSALEPQLEQLRTKPRLESRLQQVRARQRVGPEPFRPQQPEPQQPEPQHPELLAELRPMLQPELRPELRPEPAEQAEGKLQQPPLEPNPPQPSSDSGPQACADPGAQPCEELQPCQGREPTLPEEPEPCSAPELELRKLREECQRFREQTLARAELQDCAGLWRRRLDEVQRAMADWAKQQLQESEFSADLELCHGATFTAMAAEQKLEWLSGREFLSGFREEYGAELGRLAAAERGEDLSLELEELAGQLGNVAEENAGDLDELS